MKKFSIAVLFSLASLSLTGCSGNAGNSTTNSTVSNSSANSNVAVVTNSNAGNASNANTNLTNSTSRTTDPQNFMMEAAAGGIAEIEMGKLAVSKAQNPEVKQFAQQMIADHTRANNEIKALAGKKNVTLPTELDPAHKASADKLSAMTGAEFDKAYMTAQVADHEKTVALFQSQADSGTDADAKAQAAKTLPALKMHLEMAQKINAKLK